MRTLVHRTSIEAALECASKEQGRYAISGIAVDQDGTTKATDGRVAIRIPLAEGTCQDDFPSLDIPEDANTGSATIVPFSLAKKALADVPKNGHRPILNHAMVSTSKGGKVTISSTDLETSSSRTSDEVPCDFPDMSSILKRDGEYTQSRIAVCHLESILKAAKKLGGENPQLILHVPVDGCSAVHVDFHQHNEQVEPIATGVLAPLSL